MSVKKKALVVVIRAALIAIIIALPVLAASFGAFILLKTYSVSQVIVKADYLDKLPILPIEKEPEGFDVKGKAQELIAQTGQLLGTKAPELKWGEADRVNILLLGKASEDYPGSQLTDTIILLSVNPKTSQAAMLSIPRDLYVAVPETKQYTKLNAIYHYGTLADGEKGGVKYISKTIKEITGQHIDYFVMIDFNGFRQLVDEIGGINVNVEEELDDTRYPGPNYSYQTFHLDAGPQKLDGETALKYVRTRHNAGGDFGRAYRQQQVLEAMKDKFFSLEGVPLLTRANAILNIISESVRTDIELNEYPAFLALARQVNVHTMVNKVLDNRGANPILTNYSPYVGRQRAYFLRPPSGDWSEIREISENIFDLDKLAKTYAKRDDENPTIGIINHSGNRRVVQAAEERLNQAGFSQVQNLAATDEDILAQTWVYDNAEGLKPYSLDMLVKIFDAEGTREGNPTAQAIEEEGTSEEEEAQPNGKEPDLIIVLGSNAEELLEEDEIVLPEAALLQENY